MQRSIAQAQAQDREELARLIMGAAIAKVEALNLVMKVAPTDRRNGPQTDCIILLPDRIRYYDPRR